MSIWNARRILPSHIVNSISILYEDVVVDFLLQLFQGKVNLDEEDTELFEGRELHMTIGARCFMLS